MRCTIEELIRKSTNAGFRYSIEDVYKSAEFLRKEYAAVGVALPAIDPDGKECGFIICLDKEADGYYSQYVDFKGIT